MDNDATLRQELNALCDQAQNLESSVNRLDSLIDSVKATEYAKGVQAGVSCKSHEFEGKVVVLKVEDPDAFSRAHRRELNDLFVIDLKAKLVIIREDADLSDLHDIDLKALGLQRIPNAGT
jgi:hypothetical protein